MTGLSDALYEELLAAHRGLDGEGSAALNRMLVVLLATGLARAAGDEAPVREAIRTARDTARGTADEAIDADEAVDA